MNSIPRQIQIRAVHLERAREYLRGVESLAKEAGESKNPKVIMTALAVLARQHQTVSKLGVKA